MFMFETLANLDWGFIFIGFLALVGLNSLTK